MNNKELYEKALKSYKKLNEIVKNHKGTLEELCDELGGHNFEDDLFDVNYAWICATVCKTDKGLSLCNSIELWNDENFEFVGIFTIQELENLLKQIKTMGD